MVAPPFTLIASSTTQARRFIWYRKPRGLIPSQILYISLFNSAFVVTT